MKKISALLLAGAVAASLAVTASATDITAKKGTPTVDGVLDEIYTQTGSINTNNVKNGGVKVWAAGTGEAESNTLSTTYVLWDENYIYFGTKVTDSTVVDTKIVSDWKADAVEHWITYNGVKDKVSVDAFATKVYGNKASVPQDKCKFAAKATSDGYVVELAVPTDKYKAGDKITFSIQINDFLDAAATNGAAWGSQKVGDSFTLSADAVVLPKKEEPKKAAETADPTALAVLAVAAAAAGVVVAKKKH